MNRFRRCIAAALAVLCAVSIAVAVSIGREDAQPAIDASKAEGRTATVVVAAADAPKHLRSTADFVCMGKDDHLVINAAIDALPPSGGRVHLTSGSYSIGAIEGTYSGVKIARSNVLFTGEGSATRLTLQGGLTDINTIWIRGDNRNVTVRDLFIDGNGKEQIPWVRERSQWKGGNGIKIINPGSAVDTSGDIPDQTPRNVKVINCRIENCQLMAVMAHGTAVEVLNCYFTGNFGSHVVELLGHSGRIEGCTLRVKDGETAKFGFATDRSYYYQIINNKIFVEAGGKIVSHPINNWPPTSDGHAVKGREFHGIISGNILINNGTTGYVRLDGYMDVVHSNLFRNVPVVIGDPLGGMGVTFEHNMLINTTLEINSPHRGEDSRILINGNQFFNSTVKHTDGNVVWGVNPGYTTDNTGVAIIAANQTEVVVDHGLVAVPASVQLTPANNLGTTSKYWVDQLTERQFQIKVEAAPGAPTAVFHWRAVTTGTQTLSDTSP